MKSLAPQLTPFVRSIAATYGPVPVLRELFEDLSGVDQIMIQGSWAARRAGESGAFPNDIDVLVVGDAPRKTLTALASKASDRLDLPVNVTRVAPGDWSADEPSPFVATIRSRPAVDVMTGESMPDVIDQRSRIAGWSASPTIASTRSA